MLPSNLGGLEVPNILIKYQTQRLAWIQDLLDNTNPKKWQELARTEIHEKHGFNTFKYKKLMPKKVTDNFWQANLAYFNKFGGTYVPPGRTISSANDLKNQNIIQYTSSTALSKKGIFKLKDIIKKIKPDSVVYYTEDELKIKYNHTRKIHKRAYEDIINLLPQSTTPHRFFKLEDEHPYILEIISVDEIISDNKYRIKRWKPAPNETTQNGITENPEFVPSLKVPKLKTRTKHWIKNPVEIQQISSKRIKPLPFSKKPKENIYLKDMLYKIGNMELSLVNLKLKTIYNAIITEKILTHQHNTLYDTYLTQTPLWEKLPNKKMFPTLPKKLFDIRYKIIHNRIYIGRQVIHNSKAMKCVKQRGN